MCVLTYQKSARGKDMLVQVQGRKKIVERLVHEADPRARGQWKMGKDLHCHTPEWLKCRRKGDQKLQGRQAGSTHVQSHEGVITRIVLLLWCPVCPWKILQQESKSGGPSTATFLGTISSYLYFVLERYCSLCVWSIASSVCLLMSLRDQRHLTALHDQRHLTARSAASLCAWS